MEVRTEASITLAGFVPVLQEEGRLQEYLEKFTDMSRTALKMRGKKWDPSDPNLERTTSRRHSGVLGLGSIVRAYPHEMQPDAAKALLEVAKHLNDPSPIPSSVRHILSDFWKSHREQWQLHKECFSPEELDDLTEQMIAPSYYC